MSSYCTHTLFSRPYPWRGLDRPFSPLISVSWQSEPLHHHLHLHLTGPIRGRKEKKINGFSISQLSAQTTACDSPFSSNGWLTGTSIRENLYKTHYCTTCHRVIPEVLELTCGLLSHLLSLLLNNLVLIFTEKGGYTGYLSALKGFFFVVFFFLC